MPGFKGRYVSINTTRWDRIYSKVVVEGLLTKEAYKYYLKVMNVILRWIGDNTPGKWHKQGGFSGVGGLVGQRYRGWKIQSRQTRYGFHIRISPAQYPGIPKNLMVWLEFGTKRHDIYPKNAKILAFRLPDKKTVIANTVQGYLKTGKTARTKRIRGATIFTMYVSHPGFRGHWMWRRGRYKARAEIRALTNTLNKEIIRRLTSH